MPDEEIDVGEEEEAEEEPEAEEPDEEFEVGDQEDAAEPEEEEPPPEPKGDRSVESLKAQLARQAEKIRKLESQGSLSADDRAALDRAKRITAAATDAPAAPARKPYPSIYDDDQVALEEVERRATAAARIDERELEERITNRVVSQYERTQGIRKSTANLEAVKAKYPSLQNTEAHNRMVRLIDSQLGSDGLVSAQTMEQMARIVDPTLSAVDRSSAAAEAEDRIMAAEDAAEKASAVSGSSTGGTGSKRNLLSMSPSKIASVLGSMKDQNKAANYLNQLAAKDPAKYAVVMEDIDPDFQD